MLAKNYQKLWTEYIGKLDASGIQRKKIEETKKYNFGYQKYKKSMKK